MLRLRLVLLLLLPAAALGVALAPRALAITRPAAPAVLWLDAAAARGAALAPAIAVPTRYMAETGHNLAGPFQAFYDGRGGEAVFGKPLTEELAEDGLLVQYFERARMELHPDGTMSLARLGALLTDGRSDAPFHAPESPPAGRAVVDATHHTLGEPFKSFWEQNGGLELFGNPISEEFIEQVGDSPMLVQYFERVRLEYQPLGNGGNGQPRIGDLGRAYAQRLDAALLRPALPLVLLGEARFAYNPRTAEGTNIELAAKRFDGVAIAPDSTFSFTDIVGEVSARTGYQPAAAVSGGKVVADDIGGGICVVSTALYRAALHAGLDIAFRQGHSLYLNYFQDDPGLDAAVYLPGLDMRWRNDTPYPITIASQARDGALIVSLWGVSDGRKTTVTDAAFSNRVPVPEAAWQADGSVVAGQVRWVSRGGGGVDVSRTRVVTARDGTVLHRDTIVSRYRPWTGLALYGSGVTPPGADEKETQ